VAGIRPRPPRAVAIPIRSLWDCETEEYKCMPTDAAVAIPSRSLRDCERCVGRRRASRCHVAIPVRSIRDYESELTGHSDLAIPVRSLWDCEIDIPVALLPGSRITIPSRSLWDCEYLNKTCFNGLYRVLPFLHGLSGIVRPDGLAACRVTFVLPFLHGLSGIVSGNSGSVLTRPGRVAIPSRSLWDCEQHPANHADLRLSKTIISGGLGHPNLFKH